MVIFAGTRGYLDDIDMADVAAFEAGLLEWFRTRHADQLETIRTTGKIGNEDAFEAAIKAFAEQFEGTSGSGGSAPDPEAQPDADLTVKKAPVHLPEQESSRDEA